MFKYFKSIEEIINILSSEELIIIGAEELRYNAAPINYGKDIPTRRLPTWDEVQTDGLGVFYSTSPNSRLSFAQISNDFEADKLTEILREKMLKNYGKTYLNDLTKHIQLEAEQKYKKFLPENEAE